MYHVLASFEATDFDEAERYTKNCPPNIHLYEAIDTKVREVEMERALACKAAIITHMKSHESEYTDHLPMEGSYLMSMKNYLEELSKVFSTCSSYSLENGAVTSRSESLPSSKNSA